MIQYEFEMEDDPINPFDPQMMQQKYQHGAEEKGVDYQCMMK